MAACGSLQHIFENPVPENPTTLIESLSSWKQIKPPIEQSSFSEIFGQLHFKENSQSSLSSTFPVSSLSPSSLLDLHPQIGSNKSPSTSSFSSTPKTSYTSCHSKKSESLQLCTEGLGFESSDDVEDWKNEDCWQSHEERASVAKHLPLENQSGELRRRRTSGIAFPPPISSIGTSGKPWVCFKAYRQDGRFVLKEMRIPTQEFLHSCREDGRLKMHFVQPNDDILEEDEDEIEDEQYNVKEDDEEEHDEECNKDQLQ